MLAKKVSLKPPCSMEAGFLALKPERQPRVPLHRKDGGVDCKVDPSVLKELEVDAPQEDAAEYSSHDQPSDTELLREDDMTAILKLDTKFPKAYIHICIYRYMCINK